MRKASISINMLVVIIIAVIAMTIFLLFFSGKSANLFGQVGELSPSESEIARDACQIACNNAKLRTTCDEFSSVWCNKPYGDIGEMCYEIPGITCAKTIDDESCPDCSEYLESPQRTE